MNSYFDDVGDFHRKFGLPNDRDHGPTALAEDVLRFRANFMVEELAEFCRASGMDEAAVDLDAVAGKIRFTYRVSTTGAVAQTDLAEAADALADLTYVALGTGQLMGLPFDAVWAEVQRANMSKVRASGSDDPLSKRKHSLDVVKPPGFVPPDHRRAIARHAALIAAYLEEPPL